MGTAQGTELCIQDFVPVFVCNCYSVHNKRNAAIINYALIAITWEKQIAL